MSSKTIEDCELIVDVWLQAASHYWYINGYDENFQDNKMGEFFNNASLAASYLNILRMTEGL